MADRLLLELGSLLPHTRHSSAHLCSLASARHISTASPQLGTSLTSPQLDHCIFDIGSFSHVRPRPSPRPSSFSVTASAQPQLTFARPQLGSDSPQPQPPCHFFNTGTSAIFNAGTSAISVMHINTQLFATRTCMDRSPYSLGGSIVVDL